MSAKPVDTASQSDAFATLLRSSLLPTSAAAAACIVVGMFVSSKVAWSAALGAALVIFVFGLTLLIMKRTVDLAPTTVMAVMMITYTLKVLVLGVVMFLLRDASGVSGQAVGLSIMVCALVWLFFEMRAYKQLRIFVYDPEGEASLEADPAQGPQNGS